MLISLTKYAKRKKRTRQAIHQNIQNGRIPAAIYNEELNRWLIPEDAVINYVKRGPKSKRKEL